MSAYTISEDGKSITCHKCQRTSYNLNDVVECYCGYCHIWHEKLNTKRTPVRKCGVCGYEADCASNLDEEHHPPFEGDISVCLKCGEISIFNADLTERAITLNDILKMDPKDWAKSEWLQKKIRELRPIP